MTQNQDRIIPYAITIITKVLSKRMLTQRNEKKEKKVLSQKTPPK
jgi:hypothetical protein